MQDDVHLGPLTLLLPCKLKGDANVEALSCIGTLVNDYSSWTLVVAFIIHVIHSTYLAAASSGF